VDGRADRDETATSRILRGRDIVDRIRTRIGLAPVALVPHFDVTSVVSNGTKSTPSQFWAATCGYLIDTPFKCAIYGLLGF